MINTTEDLYSRQQQLNLSVPNEITVVGIGGIGAWVAIFAAMTGVKRLFLFDPDIVEESNRNRLPLCTGAVGKLKVEVIRDFLIGIRPEAEVIAVPAKLEKDFLDLQLSLSSHFIDCTDSYHAQLALYKKCEGTNYQYIRAGYDGTHITVTSRVSSWGKITEEKDANTTYTFAPSWVIPASMAAALAVSKLVKYPDHEVSVDISGIGNPITRRNTRRVTSRCNTRNR